MTPEQKLSALLAAASQPEPRGFVFSAELAQRIARRRAIYSLLAMAPVALAAVSVLWALDGVLKGRALAIDLIAPVTPALMNLGLVLILAFGGRMLARALARR